MMSQTADNRVRSASILPTPQEVLSTAPLTAADTEFVFVARKRIQDILHRKGDGLLVIVGPCSIHNYDEAIAYAERLAALRDTLTRVYIVMRVYFEKPRTRDGWKGFIYDPHLDESNDINTGILQARKLLVEITQRFRLPVATEFLDTITPQYFSDIVSYGAIGARTSESQVHRQLASGLSMPIGFKNGTNGNVEVAIDACHAAAVPHSFLGINMNGVASRIDTVGNTDSHIILRGGTCPNYNYDSLRKIHKTMQKEGIHTKYVVDLSHGNSNKNPLKQLLSALHIWRYFHFTDLPIAGIMIESNHLGGKQPHKLPLLTGLSITDACLSFRDTEALFQLFERSRIAKGRYRLYTYRESLTNVQQLYVNPVFYESAYFTVKDDEILAIATNATQLLQYGVRCAISDAIAEAKYAENPFKFLSKQNDVLTQLQDIGREKELLSLDEQIAIMDVSKCLQTANIVHTMSNSKIGYLYGKGTFSYEAITEYLEGTHVAYPSYETLSAALTNGEIDSMFVPIYNNIIGPIFTPEEPSIGTVHKRIELSIFANRPTLGGIDVLYLEPHVEKEAKRYIERYLKAMGVKWVISTRDGIIKTMSSDVPAATIASTHSDTILYKLAVDIVPHNFTTFALAKKNEVVPPMTARKYDDDDIQCR